MTNKAKILVLSPYDMMTRNLLATGVAEALAGTGAVHAVYVTRNPADAKKVAPFGPDASHADMVRPLRGAFSIPRRLADLRLIAGYELYLVLMHRFNAMHGFRGHEERLKQSWALRKPAIKEGLPVLPWLGWPFPRSQKLYGLLRRFYRLGWHGHPDAAALFERERPDLVVLAHCQNHFVMPYVVEAARRGIALLGLNGSWDQPTTKGPLVPGIPAMLVQSRNVVRDLEAFHGVRPAQTRIVGWAQMDIYAQNLANGTAPESREAFLARVGLPPNRKIILVGTYTQRLGPHEPAMCESLIAALDRGDFGPDVTLWLRCHPYETQGLERFGRFERRPDVVVERPGMDGLSHLASLLRHASCVVSSAGTIGLDAAALDTPAIAIAFEDETLPYYDRPSRRYSMEHYAAVMATGGIRKVESQTALEAAIAAYLADPAIDAKERATLRCEHLEPLDGKASQRMAEGILEAVEAARAGRPFKP